MGVVSGVEAPPTCGRRSDVDLVMWLTYILRRLVT